MFIWFFRLMERFFGSIKITFDQLRYHLIRNRLLNQFTPENNALNQPLESDKIKRFITTCYPESLKAALSIRSVETVNGKSQKKTTFQLIYGAICNNPNHVHSNVQDENIEIFRLLLLQLKPNDLTRLVEDLRLTELTYCGPTTHINNNLFFAVNFYILLKKNLPKDIQWQLLRMLDPEDIITYTKQAKYYGHLIKKPLTEPIIENTFQLTKDDLIHNILQEEVKDFCNNPTYKMPSNRLNFLKKKDNAITLHSFHNVDKSKNILFFETFWNKAVYPKNISYHFFSFFRLIKDPLIPDFQQYKTFETICSKPEHPLPSYLIKLIFFEYVPPPVTILKPKTLKKMVHYHEDHTWLHPLP